MPKCTQCETCRGHKKQCIAAVAPNTYKRDWTRCAKEVFEKDLCVVHHRLKKDMGRVKLWKEYLAENERLRNLQASV